MALFQDRYLIIDYGSRYIKGLLVQEGLGARKILRAEMLPTISAADRSAVVETEEEEALDDYEYNLVRFIQSFFPEENAFVLCMPLSHAYVRDIAIPVINPMQALEILPNEVENRVPISLEDAEVIGEYWKSDEESSHFISYTAPLVEIQNAVDPLIRTGGAVRMLTVPTAALASAVQLLPEHLYLGRVVAQAEIGYQDTFINVLESGAVCFTRSIPVGFSYLIESIQEVTKFDREKCESFLRELQPDVSESKAGGFDESVLSRYRLKKDDGRKIIRRIKEFYSEVASEIERTFISAPVSAPESVYISGGGATLPGCDDFLETAIGVPVSLYPLKLETDNIAPWVLSLGMMEHFARKQKDRIDFLSTPFGSTLRRGEIRLGAFSTPLYIASAGLIALLIGFIAGIHFDQRELSRLNSMARNEARRIVPGYQDQMDPAQAVQRVCEERLAMARNRFGGFRTLDILREITLNTPGRSQVDLEFDFFERVDQNVTVRMTLGKATDIAQVQEALRQSSMFSAVTEDRSDPLPGNKVKVTMGITLSGSGGTAGVECR
jgi:general secretion pathway protein L